MNCISPIGCPLKAGECQAAGECYLWRCSNPHEPKPVSDDDLIARFAELLIRVHAAREEV